MVDFAKWYEGKEFSSDWASNNFHVWSACLASMRDRPLNILEIGSWEGRSAIFFLEYCHRSRITCIDPFAGGQNEYVTLAGGFAQIERRFDANTASYAGRVTKLKSISSKALIDLQDQKRSYDLIYIDGAHDRDAVHVDSLLAWPLLKNGGTIIWDDYAWERQQPIETRPEEAINVFVASRRKEIKVLHVGHQLVAQKVDSGRFGIGSAINSVILSTLRMRRRPRFAKEAL
ncbi:class I SAM-dependent methyltransferase [Mesorhizobium sp. AR02]|uniref:class I SAM-dependent methyltransferase n=1 Tax=Mesorhizobium sp. AR02 TaxID=2865837 RepID=UPI00215EF05F|nr:class I SAM-dependent methyltransferase [Mesorhizobium sp. AR02]UVK55109.1 class I SAM-dependent methyltransferase [Mesorhizobium sp. AR02]